MIDLEKVLGQAPAHIKVLIHVKPDRADRVIMPESTCAYNCPRCLIEALLREVEELRRERDDEARLADYWHQRCGQLSTETPWLPAPDHKPPDLADAQMVEVRGNSNTAVIPAWQAWWSIWDEYRPLYSASGLPLCSPKGLGEWARFVATNANGDVHQFGKKPECSSGQWVLDGDLLWCPSTHRKPGPWELSLMEVMR